MTRAIFPAGALSRFPSPFVAVTFSVLLMPGVARSQIAQTVNSAGASTDWNHSLWGSPAAAPVAGKSYVTAPGFFASIGTSLGYNVTGRVRSYGTSGTSGAGSGAFAGDSLTVATGTELLLKLGDTAANLVLTGGMIRYAPDTSGAGTLSGSLTLLADSYLGVAQGTASMLTVHSSLSGNGELHLRCAQNNSNALVFDGNLSGFLGDFDIGGGSNLLTVNFNQSYSLPQVNVTMGNYGTSDRLNLSHSLTVRSFSFAGKALAAGTYSAAQLNALFGSGSQFVNNGGSLTVLPVATAKVFIVGDSTVSTYVTTGTQRGWGQEFYHYFKNGVFFADNAQPGRSSKTFITEGWWSKTLGQMTANDYVLIQFGHNDSHDPSYPEATDANSDYKTYLQRYINDSRAKGAVPILITPMHRRSFDANGTLLSYYYSNGVPTSDLAPYAAAMKQVAAANGVPCVDLFASSGDFMQRIGDSACMPMFVSTSDITHFNSVGATVMASLVGRGISEVLPAAGPSPDPKELTQYLRRDAVSLHRADLDKGAFPRPILTMDSGAGRLRLEWFSQPGNAVLQQSSDLHTWTPWLTVTAGASGSASLVPQSSKAFFRMVTP